MELDAAALPPFKEGEPRSSILIDRRTRQIESVARRGAPSAVANLPTSATPPRQQSTYPPWPLYFVSFAARADMGRFCPV